MNTMWPAVANSLQQTIYRLGTLYSVYRLTLSFCLISIFLFTSEHSGLNYLHSKLYFDSLIIFAVMSLIQLLALRFIHQFIAQQLFAIFIVDILFLSTLTFSLGGPNLSISLLFVIMVFSANFLLQKNEALIVTLISVIAVIYQQFVGSFLDISNLNNISNSALLAFLFFIVYGIGQISIQRFRVLETINSLQSLELLKLQNINRYILEQIELGYLVLDENYRIVVCNPAACSLLGIAPLYAYSHEQYSLIKFQKELFDLLQKRPLEDGQRFQFESVQSHYTIDIRVQKLLVPHQALSLLTLEDAQKINQKAQQLKLASLGQLSASIAHEIRNPLAAISQANELNLDADEEQRLMLNQMIQKQTHRINHIIQQTLDMAKNKKTTISDIQLEVFFKDLFINDLVDVKNKIALSLPQNYVIQFDDSQLRQVLINLIRNAIRHNSHDADFIQILVHTEAQHLFIDVIDFGQGITHQNLAQLFQPFFTTEINGTGLGLYLSQSICEANQAKLIYIEQKKQQGACFRIECPFKT